MRQIDKAWRKALGFFANNNRAKAGDIETNNSEEYKRNVPETVENTLINFGYILKKGDTEYIITQNGLQQLRDLDSIHHKDVTRWVAVGLFVLAFITFAISQGWIIVP